MLKKTIKKLARSLGVDLKRCNVQTSEAAKMHRDLVGLTVLKASDFNSGDSESKINGSENPEMA